MALEPPVWTVAAEALPDIVRGVVGQDTLSKVVAQHRAAATLEPSVADPAAWLAAKGWHARLYDVIDCFAAYGRPVPVGVAAASNVMRRYLATAERLDGRT